MTRSAPLNIRLFVWIAPPSIILWHPVFLDPVRQCTDLQGSIALGHPDILASSPLIMTMITMIMATMIRWKPATWKVCQENSILHSKNISSLVLLQNKPLAETVVQLTLIKAEFAKPLSYSTQPYFYFPVFLVTHPSQSNILFPKWDANALIFQ